MHRYRMPLMAVLLCFMVSPVAQAAPVVRMAATLHDGDFITTGYAQAELHAVVTVAGKPVSNATAVWEVVSLENRSQAVPLSEQGRIAGLRWEQPLPTDTAIAAYPTVTNSGGISRVMLTDSIGERTVTVAVTVTYGGKQYTAEQAVAFGKGPLSIFATPLAEPVTWYELYELCNGEPYPGNPAAWVVGMGFVGGSKVPSLEQMQSISMPSRHNSHPAALAAAVAAGWPTDRRYWNGRAVMKGRASHMDIRNGTHHGAGGNDIQAKEYGVCLR